MSRPPLPLKVNCVPGEVGSFEGINPLLEAAKRQTEMVRREAKWQPGYQPGRLQLMQGSKKQGLELNKTLNSSCKY